MKRLAEIWNAMRGSKSSQWVERIWWFDLIYPISVAVILFASLTGLVYFGKPSSRLSTLAERTLLEFALRLAPPPDVGHASQILVVNGSPTELGHLRPAPLGRRPELSAAEYARAIDKLASAGAQAIVISWDLASHPNDEVYYLPLIEVAKRYAGRTSLTFAVAPDRMHAFPQELASYVLVLADDPCVERKERTVLCPYDPDASDWVINHLLALTVGDDNAEGAWLTRQLPVNLQAFAVNIPAPDKLEQMTFGELLGNPRPPRKPPRFVFMGASTAGASSGTSDSRFVKTIFDDAAVEIDASGTPYHVFWAQLTSMLLDGAMLSFSPDWARIPISIVICIAIFIAVIAFGGPAAVAFLAAYAVLVLAVNSQLGIPQRWFLLSFDSLYFGGATLIFAATGRISYLSFRRWQAQEMQRLHIKTADLKANFVSLVSHNLTTPVAGMQGMIAIALGQTKEPSVLEQLQCAQMLTTRIELTIRFVLSAAALEDHKVNEQSRSLDSLVKEFVASSTSALKRLGIALVVPPREGELDAWMVPVPVDTKLIVTAICALVALHAPDSMTTAPVTLSFHADSGDGDGASLRVVARGKSFPEQRQSFLDSVALSLLELVARFQGGTFVIEVDAPDGMGRSTELRLGFGRMPGPALA